jgi:hypothetical protein
VKGIKGELQRKIDVNIDFISKTQSVTLAQTCQNYLNHDFNLLGSGWVNIKHGVKCNGLNGYKYFSKKIIKYSVNGDWLNGRINNSNVSESKRIWRCINKEYVPIDWQVDYKSGYRWSEKTWYKKIKFGHVRGADIKCPWELARMQHLPQLALAYIAAQSNEFHGFSEAKVYSGEIQNQILDFIAQNPPRYGVNWVCPMDVAIRISNCLIAIDLIADDSVKFNDEFIVIFKRSVYEHMIYILENLEWANIKRSNHYLSDIAGLIFTTSYLPKSSSILGVLKFALNELMHEASLQFNDDGANYEGSTSYHRLSTEILIYSSAIALSVSDELSEEIDDELLLKTRPWKENNKIKKTYQFNAESKDKLSSVISKAIKFTESVTKNDNSIAQIGDCDSGRLFKFQPKWIKDNNSYEENDLDHRHLSFAAQGLIAVTPVAGINNEGFSIDKEIIKQLSNGKNFKIVDGAQVNKKTIEIEKIITEIKGLKDNCYRTTVIELGGVRIFEGIELLSYPDFGLYILKSDKLFLSFRCGAPQTYGPSSHYHDDNLSIELSVDNKNIYSDPGSYLYTPDSVARNLYRSSQSHNGPRLIGHSATKKTNLLFDFELNSTPKMLGYTNKYLVGELKGDNWNVIRVVLLNESNITIIDGAWGGSLVKDYIESSLKIPFSFGYGKA